MVRVPSGFSPFRILFGLFLALFVGVTASVGLRGSAQEPEQPPDQEPAEAANVASEPANDPSAQPIDFSHHHHVTEIGLDCQVCHVYARRSPVAGIPSVQRCAGCHEQVLTEAPEVQKLLEFWEAEEPIPWVRVHDLPDHVRFSHKRHVLGGVDCAECHGDVGQMEAAVQVESLSMGWCLNCHQEREASRDCLICHY
jgi:hypothetical protein